MATDDTQPPQQGEETQKTPEETTPESTVEPETTEPTPEESDQPMEEETHEQENTTPEPSDEATPYEQEEAAESASETETETEEETEEDPEHTTAAELEHIGSGKKTTLKTSTGKQASNTGRNWYVVHTYSGYEDAVEKALRQRIESLNMHDLIFDVMVPKESTITIKKGEHVTEKKKLFPGYVLVEMIVTDESWYVVRNTPNVTGFVGSGTTPVPVMPEEFDMMRKHLKQDEPKFNINFSVGENVTINDGPFKGYDGMINTVDSKKGKIKVLVTLFGRETPVELDFVQVNKK